MQQSDQPVVPQHGFYGRAAALQENFGKFKPKQCISQSEQLTKESRIFWTEKVNDYDSCLQYYKIYHPEYPEALQIASARYMTNLAMKERPQVETESWDFMNEIDQIRKQVLENRAQQQSDNSACSVCTDQI